MTACPKCGNDPEKELAELVSMLVQVREIRRMYEEQVSRK